MRQSYRYDFATLAGLISASDFRSDALAAKDRRRLRDMNSAVHSDADIIATVPVRHPFERLNRAARLAP